MLNIHEDMILTMRAKKWSDSDNGNGKSRKLSKPLKGAIVGFGNVAHYAHLPVWREFEDFEITAVADCDEHRCAVAREAIPEARIYRDFTEMLEKEDIDFVDICTPPCYHAQMVKEACTAGKHVFCEKPLITRWDDLLELSKILENSDSIVFTVNNWKYAPIFTKARQLIHDGAIGRVKEVKIFVLRPSKSGGGCFDWRKNPEIAGGGILIDHGWHNLYLVLSFVEEYPKSLAVRLDFPDDSNCRVEDNVKLCIGFPNSQAKLYLTWRAKKRKNVGNIVGEKGCILIKDDHLILKNNGNSERFDFHEALSAGSHHLDWMHPVVNEFRKALEDQEEWKRNFLEAQWCARLINLAYSSCRSPNKLVEISLPVADGDNGK